MTYKLVSYDLFNDTWYCILDADNRECLIEGGYARFHLPTLLNDIIRSDYKIAALHRNPMEGSYTTIVEVNTLEELITDYPEFMV